MTYTPNTTDVREAYPHAKCLPAFYSPEHPAALAEAHAEFDRWLAAHDAEVAAQALREAAEKLWGDLARTADGPLLPHASRYDRGLWNGFTNAQDWLHDRADQIAKEDR